jgi:hypothetical protein
MTDDTTGPTREVPGYMSESLHPVIVASSDRYAITAEGPVTHLAVAVGDRVLGYLWFSDAEDAVAFVPKASEGLEARQAKVSWGARLRTARADGLSPSQAVEAIDGDDRIGRVVPGSDAQAASLDALKALAAE